MSRIRINRIANELENHNVNSPSGDEYYLYQRTTNDLEKIHIAYLLKKAGLELRTLYSIYSNLQAFYHIYTPKSQNQMVSLRVRSIDEFDKYISTKFFHTTKEIRDKIVKTLVIKNLFENEHIYYDQTNNNIFIVSFSNYLHREIYSRPKDVMKIFLLLCEDKIDPEIIELFENPKTTYEDWLEYYEKQLSIPRIESIENFIGDRRRQTIEESIISYRDRYERLMRDLNITRDTIQKYENELINLADLTKTKSTILKDIQAIPQVQDVQINTEQKIMTFSILTNLEVEEDMIKPQVVPNREQREFFQHLINGDIEIKIAQKIHLIVGSTYNLSSSPFGNDYKRLFPEFVIYPNIHIDQFSCFGNFKHNIYHSLDLGQYYQAVLLIVRSVSQLNVTDGMVYRRFIEDYYNSGTISVYVPKYNEAMSYRKYVERIKNEENPIETEI
mgnify:CR=1 FL=1